MSNRANELCSGKLQRLKTRDMLAKEEFKVLYEHTASERVAPAAATARAPPVKKPSSANGKSSAVAPTFVTHKADVDLYADMRTNRTYVFPQISGY